MPLRIVAILTLEPCRDFLILSALMIIRASWSTVVGTSLPWLERNAWESQLTLVLVAKVKPWQRTFRNFLRWSCHSGGALCIVFIPPQNRYNLLMTLLR